MTTTDMMQVRPELLAPADPFASLRRRLEGDLLTAGDFEYDTARRTVSIVANRFPRAIVRAVSDRDVATAVDYAREHGLPVSVRSGGHSLAGYSVIDDTLVVDLTRMKRVEIDPATSIARVQAGATSGDLAGPANAHGLALSTGDTHSVGMGGRVTGGGVGFMVRKFGLAIDNLVSAQVVTASGEIVTASETDHPDLFWAIRGGGGNFGIVTEFTFRMAPVGQVLGGALVLPATHEVVRGILDYSTAAPEDLTLIANLMYAPPAPFIPESQVGQPIVLLLAVWTGELEDGERALAPLRALATPVADTIGPIPYPAIYDYMAFAAEPHGASIRMMFADDLSDASIDSILDALAHPSSPFAIIQLRGMGGAFARVAPDATAFAHRDRRYFVAVINVWLDPAEDAARHEAWTVALWDRLRPEGQGVYVNFLEREGHDRVRDAYPGGTYDRLARIKHRYDPDNLFRFNQNILPRA